MASSTPTVPPPPAKSLSSALKRNIQALEARRAKEAASATGEERIAGAITAFAGSMLFVYLHLLVYGAWLLINLIGPKFLRFDPSFIILAMEASVEAIFLSTFVLISQNRMTKSTDKQAALDLQINLLAEHELTKLVGMVEAITKHFNIEAGAQDEIKEIEKDVAPEAVLDAIEEQQKVEN